MNLIKAISLKVLFLNSRAKVERNIVDQVGGMLRQIKHNKIKVQTYNTKRSKDTSISVSLF